MFEPFHTRVDAGLTFYGWAAWCNSGFIQVDQWDPYRSLYEESCWSMWKKKHPVCVFFQGQQVDLSALSPKRAHTGRSHIDFLCVAWISADPDGNCPCVNGALVWSEGVPNVTIFITFTLLGWASSVAEFASTTDNLSSFIFYAFLCDEQCEGRELGHPQFALDCSKLWLPHLSSETVAGVFPDIL